MVLVQSVHYLPLQSTVPSLLRLRSVIQVCKMGIFTLLPCLLIRLNGLL